MYWTPWVSSAAHRELPTPLPRGTTPTHRAGYHSKTHQAPQPFPCAEQDGPQQRYPGLPEELAFKFCILANTLHFTGGLYRGCGDTWDGLGSLSAQVSSSLPTGEAVHPCQAPLLTLMLQKILREQVLDLLGTSTGDLLASGWTPIMGVSRGAPNSWAAHRLLSLSGLSRRQQHARSAPKTLQARE